MKISCTKEYRKNMVRNSHAKTRKRAMEMVGNGHLVCISCGCTNVSILEINHKNRDGTKERETISGWAFYYNIVKKRRTTQDLDLLCRVCNTIHWIASKYGVKYEIKYLG